MTTTWHIMAGDDEEIVTGPFDTEAEAEAWLANDDPAFWAALGYKQEDCYVKDAITLPVFSIADIFVPAHIAEDLKKPAATNEEVGDMLRGVLDMVRKDLP